MATIKHARTLALQATSPRINPIALPANVTVGTGNLDTGAVTNPKIGTGAVDGGKIADGAVGTTKITDAAIITAKITDGSITNAKIGALAVDTANIAAAAITSAKIGALAVGTAAIADAAITNAKIGSLAVDSAKIADASITNAKIGALAVDAAKIAAATITTAKIANAAITTALIADANITTAKIADANITTAKIADAQITAAKIVDATITSAKIASATITAANIADATITSAKIDTLSAAKITTGTMNAARINGGTLSGTSIQIADSGAGWLLNAGYAGTVVYYRKLEGYNINAGNGATPGDSAVIGASGTAAAGVYGSSTGSGGHGVRGEAGNGLGFVGYNGGTYDFYAYGSASNYGPFTGAHDALVPIGASLQAGDIVVDAGVAVRKNVSNTICFVDPSSAPAQSGAVGVVCTLPRSIDIVSELPAAMMDRMWTTQPDGQRVENTIPAPEWYSLRLTHEAITINALGEGQVNVCGEAGALAIGDLITTSSLPGKGMKQADDVVRSHTVAK